MVTRTYQFLVYPLIKLPNMERRRMKENKSKKNKVKKSEDEGVPILSGGYYQEYVPYINSSDDGY